VNKTVPSYISKKNVPSETRYKLLIMQFIKFKSYFHSGSLSGVDLWVRNPQINARRLTKTNQMRLTFAESHAFIIICGV